MQKILSCHWCNAAALLMSTIAPCCPKMACSLTRQHVVSRILCWILSTWIISRSCRVLLSSGTQTYTHDMYTSSVVFIALPSSWLLLSLSHFRLHPFSLLSLLTLVSVLHYPVPRALCLSSGRGGSWRKGQRKRKGARQSLRPLSLSFCLMHPRTRPLAASTFLQQPKGHTNRH